MLLQMHGMNILIDPIFSERPSPVAFAGAKRFSIPPITVEDLPHIDILVLSHDHYDHMDYKTIMNLDEKVERYIVPLGGGKSSGTLESRYEENPEHGMVGRDRDRRPDHRLYTCKALFRTEPGRPVCHFLGFLGIPGRKSSGV